ncbi:cell division protease FtsH [Lachnobacterium bovis DSM 14045]|uniref:ATP-dependent zinc metalloprotease FtsH n=2 Tax=Lachnobacterium bovis TaxID=140626 RepID=A0A1H3IIV5_9FIRM|nr:ATP-dependent zinc metalloprotease FtsH [Lachnobacterium bovis]SDY27621.1 cell division protease FtsH [Lachnobacterium bovis DSM 14045]
MNKKMNRFQGLGVYFMVLLLLFGIWYWWTGNTVTNTYTREEFRKEIKETVKGNANKNNRIKEVTIVQNEQVPTGKIEVVFEGGEHRVLYSSNINVEQQIINDYNFKNYHVSDVKREDVFLKYLPIILIGVLIVCVGLLMSNSNSANNSSGGRMMNFGKSRARLSTKENNHITFNDVAGLKEEKEEVEEIVDFLKAPKKYTRLGARIPKGILLVGPPGTGKTLLGKAIAGEAGVPFFSISGSDFVEMFVGVGASRVRDLFEDAKKNAPCIVFIDEIDAVARKRGAGMGGGHDEREQTLNQMLVEMDGFGVNEGIIVMAATNRVDILDPAIMRPGRFDRKVYVGSPDVGGREEILEVHAKNKPLSDDVDLKQIAQTTAGFTGADLENLLNEAAILAAKYDRAFIMQEDIKKAFIKVGLGKEKRSKIISEKEKKITAYHEAGHAILFHVLPDVGPVYSVSIIPTGQGAAGYTMPLPEKDEMFNTKGKMFQEIIVDLGGRVAEEIIFDDITTGASQDIKQATRMAKAMIKRFGMSDKLGLVCYDNDDEEVFIGNEFGRSRGYSEGVAEEIDREVKVIIDKAHERAVQIINENMDVLERCAALLLKKEKISRKEFEALFDDDVVDAELKDSNSFKIELNKDGNATNDSSNINKKDDAGNAKHTDGSNCSNDTSDSDYDMSGFDDLIRS